MTLHLAGTCTDQSPVLGRERIEKLVIVDMMPSLDGGYVLCCSITLIKCFPKHIFALAYYCDMIQVYSYNMYTNVTT